MQTTFASMGPVRDMDCKNFPVLHLKLQVGGRDVSASRFDLPATHFKFQ